MQEIAFEQRKLLEQKRCMESKRLLVDLGRRIQVTLKLSFFVAFFMLRIYLL